jgi:hypothetical protein
MRHEPEDVDYRTILIIAGILVATTTVVQVAMWGLLVYFKDREDRDKRAKFPLAAAENALPPEKRIGSMPEPRLEGLKRRLEGNLDVRPGDTRGSQEERLRTYGPAEPAEAGYAHIPIEVAMKMMLEGERLPVQAPAGPNPQREK